MRPLMTAVNSNDKEQVQQLIDQGRMPILDVMQKYVANSRAQLRAVQKKLGEAELPASDNNERDVICSDSMCDYCTKIETCNGFEDDGDCFNGRKLTPVL